MPFSFTVEKIGDTTDVLTYEVVAGQIVLIKIVADPPDELTVAETLESISTVDLAGEIVRRLDGGPRLAT